MTRRLSSFATVLALLATAISFSSCKENIVVQTNLTPGADNIGTAMMDLPDSFFSAYTVYDDSVITSSGSNAYHALGWLSNDIYSGRTNARIYVQVVPTSTGFGYAANDVPDSAVLVLPYSGFTWGDTTVRSEQPINVYELDDTLSTGAAYYAFSSKPHKSTVIGTATLVTGPRGTGVISDSVTVRGARVAPHLRVTLTRSFLDDFNGRLKNSVDSFAGFLRSFKGFYLEPADTGRIGRAMPYFLMTGSGSNYGQVGMLVYAHNTATGSDSTVYAFPFNSTYTAHFNQISRNYTDEQARSIFRPGSDRLLVQSRPGGSIDFTLKHLRDLPIPKGAVIMKASLVFTEIPSTMSTAYSHPTRIYPLGIDANRVRYDVLDIQPTTSTDGLNFIDGTPRTTGTLTTFTLNIPREFQQGIIQQKSELHLRINSSQTYPAAFRALLGSNSNATYRFALKIIYSQQK